MELYEYQVKGVKFLKEKQKAILADEMGLGKTAQAIKAADRSKSVLVVCPASIKTNWKREIKAFYPKDDILVISGRKTPPAQAQKLSDGLPKWLIINYDILAHQEEWLAGLAPDNIGTMILDEAHYIKGKGAKRAKSSVKLAKVINRVYCLTGTPLLNRPVELWNLLEAINHPVLKIAGSRTFYTRRYCGGHMRMIFRRYQPPINIWDETGASNLQELREELKGYMLRRKKDKILGLPPKIIQVQEVELDNKSKREYDNAFESYVEELRLMRDKIMSEIDETAFFDLDRMDEVDVLSEMQKKIDNVMLARHLVEITKLKQVCSKIKVDRIVEDAKNAIEQGEKVIIFSQYTETIRLITEKLSSKKIDSGKTYNGFPVMEKIGVVNLIGEMKIEERQKSVDGFQDNNKIKAFVANIKAAGVGLNLTAASIVMFADMDWSPEIHNQAEDRAHRIGQTGTVNVNYYVCKDTIEEDIIEILTDKKAMVQEVIDGNKNSVRRGSVMADFIKRMNTKISTRNS